MSTLSHPPISRIFAALPVIAVVILAGCSPPGEAAPPTSTPTLTSPPPSPTPSPHPTDLPIPTPTPAPTTPPSPTLPTGAPSPTPPTTTFSSEVEEETRGDVTLVTVTNVTHYHIGGATDDEIDEQMLALGPVDPLGGHHWYALTEPLFDWSYPCRCDDAGCVTGPPTITLTLSYTLPLWQPPADVSDALVEQWEAFADALLEHERGHGALAAECAWALGEAFVALPPLSTCTQVDQAVATTGEVVFFTCREAQRRYEAETGHGRSQGVIWPP
jgi:predicted secreted Zn-dependent protease